MVGGFRVVRSGRPLPRAARAAIGIVERAVAQSRRAVNVAIVEGDAVLRRRVTSALRGVAHASFEAHDCASALQLLRATPIDVLYTAEHLARFSGPDLLARLERDGMLASLSVVVRVVDEASFIAIALRSGGMHTVGQFSEPASIVGTILLAAGRSPRLRMLRAAKHEAARRLCEQSRRCRAQTRALLEQTQQLIASAHTNCERSRLLASALVASSQPGRSRAAMPSVR